MHARHTDSPKNGWKRTTTLIGVVLILASAVHAEEECSAEVKLLLSPPTLQAAIASLGFANETTSQVYFFDTAALDLQKQGVIVRIRQGANDDLTVKVRVPASRKQADVSRIREHFPCEINRTGTGEDTDYSVKRRYKTPQVPATGSDIFKLLSPPQKRLLQEAQVAIDWSRVKKIAHVQSSNWESTSQSPFNKLALELWEWPAGKILEISAKSGSDKSGSDARESSYSELRLLLSTKNLSLDTSQGSKTSMVFDTATHRTSKPH